MKKILLAICFFTLLKTQAQVKKYEFDYLLKYEITDSLGVNKQTEYLLVNSKDNSYFLKTSKKTNDTINIRFLDYSSGCTSRSEVTLHSFLKAETINNECNVISRFSNPYKYQTKNYYFENLKDTLIDGIKCNHYVIKSNKGYKYQKRKGLHKFHFIVKKNNSDFLPYLFSATPYEEWKEERNIPNGMLVFYYQENWDGKVNYYMKLSNYRNEIRHFTFPEDCLKSLELHLKN